MRLLKTTGVIDAIIGEIHPAGETQEDNERYDNLEELMAVVKEYVQRIENVAENRNSRAFSMKRAGDPAYKFRKSLTEYEV